MMIFFFFFWLIGEVRTCEFLYFGLNCISCCIIIFTAFYVILVKMVTLPELNILLMAIGM
jgi:hypothetical protein